MLWGPMWQRVGAPLGPGTMPIRPLSSGLRYRGVASLLEAGERAGVPQSILVVLRGHRLRLCVFPTLSPASCPVVFPGGRARRLLPAGLVEQRGGRGGSSPSASGLSGARPQQDRGLLVHAVRAHSGLQEPAHRVLASGERPSVSLAAPARSRISTTTCGGRRGPAGGRASAAWS